MILKSSWLAASMEEKEDFWGEIESAQTEEIPSVMISGETQSMTASQQIYGTQQQMILMQQPSSAPKIIGVLMIIVSVLTFFSAFTSFSPQVDAFTGEVIETPLSLGLVNLLSAIVGTVAFGVGGYFLVNYQRRGVHVAFLGIGINIILGIVAFYLGGDAGLGNQLGKGTAMAIGGFLTLVCNTICGLIIAIPLMSNSHGLDDSSLFRK